MKKLGILFLIFLLIPFKVSGMIDEGNNSSAYEGKPGEYQVMVTDEQNNGQVAPDEGLDLDQAVLNDNDGVNDNVNVSPDNQANDTDILIAENNMATKASKNIINDDNIVLYMIGIGVLGCIIGGTLVYFLTKKHDK